MSAASKCCARSSPTTCPTRSQSGPRRSSNGTTSVCPAQPCATTWPRSRKRATSPSRTPAPAGCRPTRATASSSTGSRRSSRSRPPNARPSPASSTARIDLDDVLKRTVRLLAQLTRQVAVVQYPTLTTPTVRHLEVVPLTPARLMLVLITDNGRVDQRMVDLGDVVTEEDVAAAADRAQLGHVRPAAERRRRARRRAARPGAGRAAGRAHPRHDRAGRVAGRAPGRTPGPRRHREPHAQRRRLPGLAAPGPRSPRGAGGRAQAAGRRAQPRYDHGAHR